MFMDNQASRGAAINVDNVTLINLINNTFWRNNAIVIEESIENRGGAIFFDCIKFENGCVMSINNCSFIENYANSFGGAIAYTSETPLLSNTTFANNSAGLHSDDIGSFISSIKPSFPSLIPIPNLY